MKPEIIEISDNKGRLLTKGKYYSGSKNNGRVVIAQGGLGRTIDSPGLIGDLIKNSEQHGNYSVFAIEHPGHGLNQKPGEKTIFTLQDCEHATIWGVQRLLEKTSELNILIAEEIKAILVGGSLGYWTLFQALAKAHCINENILALLGKSGIVSYKILLGRILQGYGHPSPGAWEKFTHDLRMGDDGWGEMRINPEDPGVPIHRSLLEQVHDLNERDTTGKPVEAWHGEMDRFTALAEMQAHNGGEIIVHTERGVGHSLNRHPGDTNSQRVNGEMIHRINEIFEGN